MRITYLFPERIPNTKARFIQSVNTVYHIAALGYEVSFINGGMNKCWEDILSDFGLLPLSNLRPIAIRKRFLNVTSTAFFHYRLGRLLIRRSADFLVVRHLKTAHYLIKNCDQKVVYEVHEVYCTKHPQNYSLQNVEQNVINGADGLIFISKGLKEEVSNLYRFKCPWMIIPSATYINPSVKSKKLDYVTGDIYYIGSINYPWKGVECLLEAVEQNSAVKLNIIGECSGLLENSLAIKLIRAGKLVLHGYMPHHEVRRRLESATITIIPNTSEHETSVKYTSPLKLLEYMACKTAIVASDLPSIREIVNEDEVLFVPPCNSNALSAAIETLLGNSQLRNKLAEAAYQKSFRYTWSKRATNIVNFLESLK